MDTPEPLNLSLLELSRFENRDKLLAECQRQREEIAELKRERDSWHARATERADALNERDTLRDTLKPCGVCGCMFLDSDAIIAEVGKPI